MPFWRTEEPEHERQAREAGIDLEGTAPPGQPPPLEPQPRFPFLGALREPGVHGIHRQREWDVVATTVAPGLAGDRILFLVLPDETLLIEDGEGGELEPLARAVEGELEPPYRAVAVRQEGDRWAVAANRIEAHELAGLSGDVLTLTHQGMTRDLLIDGVKADESVPALEQLAEERYDAFVLEAERLDGDLWEVRITPL